MRPTKSRSRFARFAKWTAHATGRPAAFLLASTTIVVWVISGPIFGFSDTWQLVINTGTTIVTFLMAFLIQSTQNRDSEAVQVKLDEIIRAIGNAKNELLDLEELEEEDLDRIRDHFSDVTLDLYVVMPNHAHGIVALGATHPLPLRSAGASASRSWCPTCRPRPPGGPIPRSIGAIVGSFKSAVTKHINSLHRRKGATVWQRNYHEHIIRNERDLRRIRRYIVQNPVRWSFDNENPAAACAAHLARS